MQLGEQGTAAIGLAGALLLLGGVLAQPLFLIGAACLGSVILAKQLVLITELHRTNTSITVEQSVSRQYVTPNEPTRYQLDASRTIDLHGTLSVAAQLPPYAQIPHGDSPAIALDTLEAGTRSIELSWAVAGSHTIGRPRLHLADPDDWLETDCLVGNELPVLVEPAQPPAITVSQGGQPVAAAYGEHEGGPFGHGITPAELRRYLPGDTAGSIDWKATARLGEPYVREYESESDLEALLVLDHRAAVADADQFVYLREFALGYVSAAQSVGDPVGLVSVGDGGITTQLWPQASESQYRRLRDTLVELTPTQQIREPSSDTLSPAVARELASTLRTADNFTIVAPYFDARDAYLHRIAEQPLFTATQHAIDRLSGNRVTVLLTDDSARTEIWETAKLASRGAGQCLVFLTPRALYDTSRLSDLDAAAERYVSFESFRRDLDAMPGVRAFEITPSDRPATLLANPAGARSPA